MTWKVLVLLGHPFNTLKMGEKMSQNFVIKFFGVKGTIRQNGRSSGISAMKPLQLTREKME